VIKVLDLLRSPLHNNIRRKVGQLKAKAMVRQQDQELELQRNNKLDLKLETEELLLILATQPGLIFLELVQQPNNNNKNLKLQNKTLLP